MVRGNYYYEEKQNMSFRILDIIIRKGEKLHVMKTKIYLNLNTLLDLCKIYKSSQTSGASLDGRYIPCHYKTLEPLPTTRDLGDFLTNSPFNYKLYLVPCLTKHNTS